MYLMCINLLMPYIIWHDSYLCQVTLGRADSILDDTRPDDIDLAVLRNIQTTSKRSTKLNDGLKNMKLRIHNMELATNRVW